MFVEADGRSGCHATTHGRKLGIPDKVRHSTLEALHFVIDIFQVMLKQIGICKIETPYTVFIHVESSHNPLCIGSLLIDQHILAC